MGSNKPWAAFLLAVAIGLASPSVSAEPSLADLAQARDLRNQGRDLRKSGDLRGALEKFKAAHALGQTAVTGIELARTHALLRELVEAREVCLGIARMPVASDETHFSVEAREEATAMAEELRMRIPTLTVKLRGVPEGTLPTVLVDRRRVPDAALGEARKVNPGPHEIVAKIGEGEETKESLELAEGETKEVTLDVKAPAVVTPPLLRQPIVEQPIVPRVVYSPPPSGKRALVSGALIVGGVGLAVGVVAGGIAIGKSSDLKRECTGTKCPPSAYDTLDSAKTMGTVSTIAFAVTGVAAVLVVYGILSEPARPTNLARPRIVPLLGLGSVGMHATF